MITKILKFLFIITLFFAIYGCSIDKDKYFERLRDDFRKELDQYSWEEPEKIYSLIEETIYYRKVNLRDNIGSSRIAGTPDLPSSIEWPTYQNKPMVFIAQLNLAEIKDYHRFDLLPTRGIIYFFSYYEDPESEYGAVYDFIRPKEEYKIIYYDGDFNELSNRDFPKDLISDYHFEGRSLEFEIYIQVPMTQETWIVEEKKLTMVDAETYEEFVDNYDSNCEYEFLLGTPCPIQYFGVDHDWAYGYIINKVENIFDPKNNSITEKIRPNFINLFSFNLEYSFNNIGDSRAYFGIQIDDLKNKSFDKAVFIMQDT